MARGWLKALEGPELANEVAVAGRVDTNNDATIRSRDETRLRGARIGTGRRPETVLRRQHQEPGNGLRCGRKRTDANTAGHRGAGMKSGSRATRQHPVVRAGQSMRGADSRGPARNSCMYTKGRMRLCLERS